MTKTPESEPSSIDEDFASMPEARQLGRRLFIFRATAILTGAAAFPVSRAWAKEATDWDSADYIPIDEVPRRGKRRRPGKRDQDSRR
jgi:hypothetical protein